MHSFDATKGFIRISRPGKGLLKTKPVTVLVGNLPIHLFPGEAKAVLLPPGMVTLTLNKYKRSDYKVVAGETRILVLREGFSKPGFCIKYGASLLMLLCSVYCMIHYIAKDHILFAAGLLGLLANARIIAGIGHEYFYLHEKKELRTSRQPAVA